MSNFDTIKLNINISYIVISNFWVLNILPEHLKRSVTFVSDFFDIFQCIIRNFLGRRSWKFKASLKINVLVCSDNRLIFGDSWWKLLLSYNQVLEVLRILLCWSALLCWFWGICKECWVTFQGKWQLLPIRLKRSQINQGTRSVLLL